jgi:hypothetical protein
MSKGQAFFIWFMNAVLAALFASAVVLGLMYGCKPS